jgi:hypothetical protein
MNDDLSLAGVAFAAGLAALTVAGDHAAARSARTESSVEFVQSRIAGEPIMANAAGFQQANVAFGSSAGVLDSAILTHGIPLTERRSFDILP